MEALREAATRARENAFAPHSGISIGAAVLTSSGMIYNGCNIENDSFSLTICAERCAIFKAISEGDTEIRAIAIAFPSDTPESNVPCGACRQVMAQFSVDPIIVVFSQSETNKMRLSELLPLPFRLSRA